MQTRRWRARLPHYLVAVVAGLAVGCAATRETTALVSPSPEELPDLAAHRTDTQQAVVRVDSRSTEARLVLAPEFKEPPLTAAEKKALGEKEPVFQLLPYDYPWHVPGSPVAGWMAGLDTRDIGWGGADADVSAARTSAVQAGIGGPAIGYDPRPQPIGNVQDAATATAHVGPEAGLQTRSDRESHVARQQPHRDK